MSLVHLDDEKVRRGVGRSVPMTTTTYTETAGRIATKKAQRRSGPLALLQCIPICTLKITEVSIKTLEATPSKSKTDPHLGCEEVMLLLEECHDQGFLHKLTGGCNEIKREVNKCLRAERLERQDRNREVAKKKREHIKAIWADIDQNS